MPLKLDESKIRTLWERGNSVSAIARALGVCHATITARLAALQLPRPGRPELGEPRSQRLIAAWNGGVPVARIALDVGLSEDSVRLWARDFGLAPRRPGAVFEGPSFDPALLRQLWAQGLTARHIAGRLGVSHPTVYTWAARLGLPVPNPACAVAIRPRGAARSVLGEDHRAGVLEALARGESQRRIAEGLGVSQSTLVRFIARLTVPPAPPPEPAPQAEPAPPRLPRLRLAARPEVRAAAAPLADLSPFDSDLAKALTWADLRAIAARHGKPLSLAQSRWHRLRGQVAA